jgi:hypothetical protein
MQAARYQQRTLDALAVGAGSEPVDVPALLQVCDAAQDDGI